MCRLFSRERECRLVRRHALVGLQSVLVHQPHLGSDHAVQAHVRVDVALELCWAHRSRAIRVLRGPLEAVIALRMCRSFNRERECRLVRPHALVGLQSVLVRQPHPGSGRAVQAHVRADVALELYWAHQSRAIRVLREPLEAAIARERVRSFMRPCTCRSGTSVASQVIHALRAPIDADRWDNARCGFCCAAEIGLGNEFALCAMWPSEKGAIVV